MREVIPFCILIAIVIGGVIVIDVVAIKKARKVSLERPDLITIEGE